MNLKKSALTIVFSVVSFISGSVTAQNYNSPSVITHCYDIGNSL